MNRLSYLIPVVVIALAALLSSIFIVDEREKVLVLRFGQIKQERVEPGWYLKVPLLDEVVSYEDRILSIETPLIEVTPADDRRLVVDAFVLWRIEDIVQFRQALGAGDERAGQRELSGILEGQIRAVLGDEGLRAGHCRQVMQGAGGDILRLGVRGGGSRALLSLLLLPASAAARRGRQHRVRMRRAECLE